MNDKVETTLKGSEGGRFVVICKSLWEEHIKFGGIKMKTKKKVIIAL